ncbi:hypothetical protein GCM10009839_51380 [Catenulispora yoronensis]|uniref:WD40 repeat protein n=1 Tax=Catenulispora yoronensis TaxID=450799 RepID=A0ABP5GCB5_9ACTN
MPESAASSSGGAKPSDAKASASASSKGGAASGDSIPGLTLSGADDTKILINGKAVDFGMPVYDHTWSPDGKKVAFIDDKSNLWVANADGSGKTEVAKNTTEDKWAHPTWQVAKADPQSGVGAKNNLIFYSTAGNDTLWTVPATAKNGKPQLLSLGAYAEDGAVPPPKDGNMWPSAAGQFGSSVYQHDNGKDFDIYVRDDYLRQQGDLAFQHGEQPDLVMVGGSATTDPDPEVVFLREVGGSQHVFLVSLRASDGGSGSLPKAKDLTPDLKTGAATPALSPDGKTVVYSSESGVYAISVDGSWKPKKLMDGPGLPVFRPGS